MEKGWGNWTFREMRLTKVLSKNFKENFTRFLQDTTSESSEIQNMLKKTFHHKLHNQKNYFPLISINQKWNKKFLLMKKKNFMHFPVERNKLVCQWKEEEWKNYKNVNTEDGWNLVNYSCIPLKKRSNWLK